MEANKMPGMLVAYYKNGWQQQKRIKYKQKDKGGFMKKVLAAVVLSTMLLTSTKAYAGSAWPWVVGGIAGAALLTSVAAANDHHVTYVHEYYPEPSYSYCPAPAYTPYCSRPVYTSYYSPEPRYVRVWHEGYYDSYGYWHSGYYSLESSCH